KEIAMFAWMPMLFADLGCILGGVGPCSPKAGKVLGTKAQIQFSAGSLSLNDVPATILGVASHIDNYQPPDVHLRCAGAGYQGKLCLCRAG
ncbi:hypothetical protein O5343_26430, partial [Escherichia coli]|nr:hypothetical protein [Escherichia coli]